MSCWRVRDGAKTKPPASLTRLRRRSGVVRVAIDSEPRKGAGRDPAFPPLWPAWLTNTVRQFSPLCGKAWLCLLAFGRRGWRQVPVSSMPAKPADQPIAAGELPAPSAGLTLTAVILRAHLRTLKPKARKKYLRAIAETLAEFEALHAGNAVRLGLRPLELEGWKALCFCHDY